MFTGLIEELATISDLVWQDTNLELSLQANLIIEDMKLGDSIAHNGVCLTITKIDKDKKIYSVQAIKETLDKTNLDSLEVGHQINVERCLTPSQRLGGHIVQGHVDTTAILDRVIDQNGSYDLYFQLNSQNDSRYLIPKGSVAISGISLTVVNVDDELGQFSVSIIPKTWEDTNLKSLSIGDKVNIEFDVLAKYIEKLSLLKK